MQDIAKKMGLPINKLIIATNNNDILKRVINTGIYKPQKWNTQFLQVWIFKLQVILKD